MSIDVGLYFGGSSMSIAYYRDNKVSVIVNEAGDRWTPSLMAINANEFSVGLPVKQNLIRNARNTISNSKHFIGKVLGTVDAKFISRNECQIIPFNEEKDIAFVLEKDDKPLEISLAAAIEAKLKYLNDLAKTSLGVKECVAVLSVPVYFTEQQTHFLNECATKAGFQVHRVIKNPVAACLAYDIEEDNTKDGTILVYQMGGSTIEVTLMEITNGLYRTIDSLSVHTHGGDLFTDIVVDILCEEFMRKHKSDPRGNKRSVFKLNYNAQELKHVLSTMERAHCSIDALFEGQDFEFFLTRQRFDVASGKLCQQVLKPIDELLARNQLSEKQVNQVIVCGAAAKMVNLQTLIKQKFADAKMLNILSPDEVIALGCAKQAFVMSTSRVCKSISKDVFFKCLSTPIYIKIGDNSSNVQIVAVKTPLPLKRTLNVSFDLTTPFISFLESEERVLAKMNLDKFTTKDISILFVIKMNETVEITVTETSSNEKLTMFLNGQDSNAADVEP